MFDRAARAARRVGAAPSVDIAVLTALATLLQDVRSVSGAASQLRDSSAAGSHDANRGDVQEYFGLGRLAISTRLRFEAAVRASRIRVSPRYPDGYVLPKLSSFARYGANEFFRRREWINSWWMCAAGRAIAFRREKSLFAAESTS
jgi:hypothetical protein